VSDDDQSGAPTILPGEPRFTLEEIVQRRNAIKAGWTDAEREHRARGGDAPPAPWTFPEVSFDLSEAGMP
jgi:hypothetical protein